ncbi:hypothetical protein PHYSODRAFT_502725 [Phytophthora sojae]|uniref:Uncharacterized protein n=1 Tax=Phytophthora sojae (strain P6497) TaxID=1094619 RepID=G4ZCU3_PHYSP|nr:hypothetical protein PHYSODRAFT_502725 [Phytophthora sojae]EGZ18301.1 hypothetical protein PHYSODRAFT_502725 [Phytophthora sojae]|eukprot:XP_009527359.1 hypothetical protein PHYSODRAFT_502725 [Phytophthora sojae]
MVSPDSTTHKFRFRFGNRLTRKPSKRKGSVSRRLLTLLHPDTVISTNTLRAILSKSVTEEVVWEALQTLFHSEYLLMSMYIRCMLPMLYSGYLSLLFLLPVKAYYPQTVELTPERLGEIVGHITVFGAVEFVGFAGLILVLRRKFGISPLFQLAFVLETQARTVQGHLFVWTIFILHLPLFHYGKYTRPD